MMDKRELCCPLSHELFDDPVVAADGITYERSWVEKQLKRVPFKSPMTGLRINTKGGEEWGNSPWMHFKVLYALFWVCL